MITNQLLDFIDKISEGLSNKHSGNYKTELEYTLAKLSKLTEEVWELNSEILKKYFKDRKTFSQENLEWEFTDVLFTTLLLAKALDIDINKSIENKLKVIKERWII